jgi:hypothetical protein
MFDDTCRFGGYVVSKPLQPGWWRDDAQAIKARQRPRYLENREQMALFTWLRTVRYQGQPLTHYAWHTPNGGLRNAREAARLKALGVKAGVPDVSLTIAAQGFHGLYIELKAGKGRVTDEQKTVCEMLIEQGYCVLVAYSWHDAAGFIVDYLDLPASVRPR